MSSRRKFSGLCVRGPVEKPKTIEHLSEGYKITKVNWLWCGKKSPVEGLEVKGKRNGKKKYCCYYFLFFVFLTFSRKVSTSCIMHCRKPSLYIYIYI